MVIKLTVAYDGTNYCGWQIQPNGITVQEVLTAALNKLLGKKVNLTGSGRTDSGVHASAQVASFMTDDPPLPPERFAAALNGLLPPDIRVKKSEKAPDGFNARFAAKRKTYVYKTYIADVDDPLRERYACRIGDLDVAAMERAAKKMAGTHDYRCFLAANSAVRDTERTIYSLNIEKSGDEIEFKVTGNGFLYNMVRIMVGTLIAVGEGKLTADDVEKIIESGDRRLAGKTVPAKGLTLLSVEY